MSSSAFTPAVLTIPSTGGGTGTGEISVITNGSAVNGNVDGWTSVNAVSTNSPLNPTISTAFSISNVATVETATSGGYASFTLPSGLQNRKLKVEFYYTTPATDNYAVSVWKGTTRVPLSTDSGNATNLPKATTGKFTAYFDTDTTASWTLNITRTNGAIGPCYITSVIVGPGIQPQGAVVGEWLSYTPTGPWSANTTYAGKYRRVGDSLELVVDLALAGAPTSASLIFTEAQILNGLSLNVDSTKFPITTDFVAPVGTWSALDSGVSGNYGGHVTWNGSQLFAAYPTGANTAQVVNQASPFTFGSADNVSIRAKLPIAQWAGSGTVQLAQNDVEYVANDGTANVYGPAGSAMPTTSVGAITRTVTFQTPIQATDILTVEYTPSVGGQWLSGVTSERGGAGTNWLAYSTASEVGWGEVRQVSATQVSVVWRRYKLGTTNWGGSADGYWRVRKSSAGAAVGFGIVSGSSAGLLPASNSNLDDATATRLGLKQYLHGTTYNGGLAPTVTCAQAGFTVVRAVFIPYQTQDGSWRLRFNASATFTSATVTSVTISTNGILVKNLTNYFQPISALTMGPLSNFQIAYANPNTSNFVFAQSSGTQTGVAFSGDIELDSKPTWAY